MATWREDFNARHEQRERARRQFHSDVKNEVLIHGGNADRVDYDRVEDSYSDGFSVQETAREEIRLQQPQNPDS